VAKKPIMMLVVEGDHNDADYIVSVSPITEKDLKRFTPLIAAIRKFKPYKGKSQGGSGMEFTHDHNWPVGDYGYRGDLGSKTITELYGELAEEFDQDYVPHEDGNIHTINKISVMGVKRVLFDTGR